MLMGSRLSAGSWENRPARFWSSPPATAGTRAAPYDLVVTDVDMPRMDGIQLVRHIKDDARLSSIPVVVVSYKDREEDRIRGLDAGANAYLTKSSFHDQTFLTTVADLMGDA